MSKLTKQKRAKIAVDLSKNQLLIWKFVLSCWFKIFPQRENEMRTIRIEGRK